MLKKEKKEVKIKHYSKICAIMADTTVMGVERCIKREEPLKMF